MKVDKIIIGADTITEKNVLSGSCYLSNSIACEELTIDTLGATVDCSAGVGTKFLPKGSTGLITKKKEPFYVRPIIRVMVHDLKKYAYGEEVLYYRDGVLFAKFYMESVKRVGKFNYEITCTSAIGLLENSDHYGGIYTGQKMSAVLADIIGGKIAYELDPLFANVTVYGWLPIATRRENLHQLLFAEGASIKKKPDGTLLFTVLSADAPKALPGDRLFLGGDVDYQSAATAASIFEHAYVAYATDDVVTLYEGEAPADALISPSGATLTGTMVRFDGPMHDLAIENSAVLESGTNYAILHQSISCKLTGKKYTHTTRTITTEPPATRGLVTVADNTVTVKDATLVSLANSENVAKRIMAYYGSTKLISTDLVVGTERPGDPVTFQDPYDEPTDGFIQSLDISMGGILRAAAKLASGYKPTGIGNNYNRSVTITQSGMWTVPAGVRRFRAVLIGGGQGGQSGGQGAAGARAGDNQYGNGGAGGQSGGGGTGGKVNVVTITVSDAPGQSVAFGVDIGAGGAGGVSNSTVPTPGNAGGSTSIGGYSSADGLPSENGYKEIFSGKEFAAPGGIGVSGAAGSGANGTGPSITFGGVTYTPGVNGADASGSGASWTGNAYGGRGGGAAAGGNGIKGQNGSVTENGGKGFADGGDGGAGGAGGNGSNATVHGAGGSGGNGGGGGGGGGPASHTAPNLHWAGDGGAGGLGGTGGQGAPGCVIIYYSTPQNKLYAEENVQWDASGTIRRTGLVGLVAGQSYYALIDGTYYTGIAVEHPFPPGEIHWGQTPIGVELGPLMIEDGPDVEMPGGGEYIVKTSDTSVKSFSVWKA